MPKTADPAGYYTEELQRRYEKVGIGLLGGPQGDLGAILIPMAGPTTWRPGRRPMAKAEARYEYAEVSVSDVSRTARKVASATISSACSELGLRAQAMRFFGLRLSGERALFNSDKSLLGRIYMGQVWLAWALDPQQTVETAAHETRHRWQNENGWYAKYDDAASECDAEAYARTFWARHGSRLLALAAAA